MPWAMAKLNITTGSAENIGSPMCWLRGTFWRPSLNPRRSFGF